MSGPSVAAHCSTCPTCAAATPAGGRFCAMCGMPLAAAGPGPGSAARKNIVVLFTDLVDFTPLGERLDPEALERVLDSYFRAAAEAVAGHGGIIEKFIGDAVMAVFGLPVSHGDDAVRAVHAALRLHAEIDRLNATALRAYGVNLVLRTGIGSGEVAVSTALDGSYRVIGDPVNTSARLQQTAAPGEIVLGNTAAWMARGAVELEPRPPIRVKGKSQPQHVWTVRGPAHGRSPAAIPLIGRQTERARLDAALRRAASAGQGTVLLLSGPAGIGKSRLLAECARAWQGTRVIAAACPAWGGRGPLDPIRTLATDAFGEGWVDVLADLLPADDTALVAERLGRALGLRQGTTGPQETAWSLRRLLEQMAADQTLAVFCDDFHHAEPALLDLLRDAVPKVRAPLLFVAAARSQFTESSSKWLADIGAEHVELGPLRPEQSRVLAQRLCEEGARSLPTPVEAASLVALAERVAAAAEGNPLFAEQFAAALLDDPDASVPPTVQALLESRFDALGEAERSLLQRAAVVGRAFTVEQVSPVADQRLPVPLRPTVDRLVQRSMLRTATGADGGRIFEFVPGLLHDTAYGSAPKAERSTWHEAFGRWLCAIPDSAPEVVGHHFETAYLLGSAVGAATASPRLAADAAGHLIDAAARADDRGDLASAADALRRALRLLPAHDARRRDAALLLCDLELELGDAPAAIRALDDQGTALADDPTWPDVKALQLAMVEVRADPGRIRAARALIERAPSGAAAADADVWFRHHLLAAHIHLADMRLSRATTALLAALEHTAGHPRDEVRVLIGLAELALWGPEPVRDATARCAVLGRRLRGDRARLVPVQAVQAALTALTGEFDGARRLADTARDSAAELGLSYAGIALSQTTALIEALAGCHAEAEAEYRRGAQGLRELGQQSNAAAFHVLAARQLFEQGRRGEAADLLESCRADVDSADVGAQVAAWSLRARLDSAAGRPDDARYAAIRAVKLADGTDDLRSQGDAWHDQSIVLMSQGDRRAAGRSAAEATRRYLAKGATLLAARSAQLERTLR